MLGGDKFTKTGEKEVQERRVLPGAGKVRVRMGTRVQAVYGVNERLGGKCLEGRACPGADECQGGTIVRRKLQVFRESII